MPSHVFGTIHIFDIVLHGVFLITPLMAPLFQQEAWHGPDSLPHTTADLKDLKNGMIGGAQVLFRNADTTIWLKQGPSDHHRTDPFGVIISAIPVDGDNSDLAKKIGRISSFISPNQAISTRLMLRSRLIASFPNREPPVIPQP